MQTISFLIVSYNLEEWLLRRCIDSIIGQFTDSQNYEIIFVDDGSTLSPENMLGEYTPGIITYYHQENSGPGAARNKAIQLAKGDLLMFVDGDDYLFPGAIRSLSSLIREYQPDILSFSYKPIYIKEIEKITYPSLQLAIFESGASYMKSRNLQGINWLYIFRRDLIISHNLRYTEKILHEDEDFITRLFFFAGKVIGCNQPIYAYYQRPGSIVQCKKPEQEKKRFEDFLFVIEKLCKFQTIEHNRASFEQRQGLQRKLDFLAVDFLLKTFRSTRPKAYWEQYSNRLRSTGLYPVRVYPYSIYYFLFSLLTRFRFGLKLVQIADNYRMKKRSNHA